MYDSATELRAASSTKGRKKRVFSVFSISLLLAGFSFSTQKATTEKNGSLRGGGNISAS